MLHGLFVIPADEPGPPCGRKVHKSINDLRGIRTAVHVVSKKYNDRPLCI